MRRSAWLGAAAILVLVSIGFNLARQSSYTASMELFPGPVGEFQAVRDPGFYRAFVDDPILRREMRRNVSARFAEYRDADFARTPRGTVVLSVQADTPGRARRLANALSVQIAGATSRDVEVAIRQRIAVIAGRLRRTRARSDRAVLQRWIRDLQRLRQPPPQRVSLPRRPGPASPHRWADRLAEAAPGAFAGRSDPLWAGVAGVVVAASLWSCAQLLPRRRPRRRSRPPAR